VEVAGGVAGVAVRDSKRPLPCLTFQRAAWATFVAAVRVGPATGLLNVR
jgi:hypothetical protein